MTEADRDRACAEISKAVCQASVGILERLELAGELLGSGHHAAQQLGAAAAAELRRRTETAPLTLGCEHGRLPGHPCPHCLGINEPPEPRSLPPVQINSIEELLKANGVVSGHEHDRALLRAFCSAHSIMFYATDQERDAAIDAFLASRAPQAEPEPLPSLVGSNATPNWPMLAGLNNSCPHGIAPGECAECGGTPSVPPSDDHLCPKCGKRWTGVYANVEGGYDCVCNRCGYAEHHAALRAASPPTAGEGQR